MTEIDNYFVPRMNAATSPGTGIDSEINELSNFINGQNR